MCLVNEKGALRHKKDTFHPFQKRMGVGGLVTSPSPKFLNPAN